MSIEVRLKMLEKTLAQIELLQQEINAPSRSDVVRRAVDMFYDLMDYEDKGYKITLIAKHQQVELEITRGK